MQTPADKMQRPGTPARRLLISLLGLSLAAVLFAAPSFGSDAQIRAAAHSGTGLQSQRMTVSTLQRYAKRMLARLNQQRHGLGRRPLRMNVKLIHSAHLHDVRMARHNELSHQLAGEAYFGDRITHAGYHWRSAGENIGWTSDHSVRGLLALEDAMFHEKPPENGHRLNIINRSFRHVGIDVYWDRTHRKLWFTQDFGQPA